MVSRFIQMWREGSGGGGGAGSEGSNTGERRMGA
jgi:hypothetical protein